MGVSDIAKLKDYSSVTVLNRRTPCTKRRHSIESGEIDRCFQNMRNSLNTQDGHRTSRKDDCYEDLTLWKNYYVRDRSTGDDSHNNDQTSWNNFHDIGRTPRIDLRHENQASTKVHFFHRRISLGTQIHIQVPLHLKHTSASSKRLFIAKELYPHLKFPNICDKKNLHTCTNADIEEIKSEIRRVEHFIKARSKQFKLKNHLNQLPFPEKSYKDDRSAFEQQRKLTVESYLKRRRRSVPLE